MRILFFVAGIARAVHFGAHATVAFLLLGRGGLLFSVLSGYFRLRSLDVGRIGHVIVSRRIVSSLFEPDEVGAYLRSGERDGRGLRKSRCGADDRTERQRQQGELFHDLDSFQQGTRFAGELVKHVDVWLKSRNK